MLNKNFTHTVESYKKFRLRSNIFNIQIINLLVGNMPGQARAQLLEAPKVTFPIVCFHINLLYITLRFLINLRDSTYGRTTVIPNICRGNI